MGWEIETFFYFVKMFCTGRVETAIVENKVEDYPIRSWLNGSHEADV